MPRDSVCLILVRITVHMLIVDAASGARPEPEASATSTARLVLVKRVATRRDLVIEACVRIISSCGDQSVGETPGPIPNPEAKA